MYKYLSLVLLCIASWQTSFAKPAEAIFAGGCFWNLQADFGHVKGVLDTITGYDGGNGQNPTYNQVYYGKSDYIEAVRVIYNPAQITYRQLVDYFWHRIDPTAENAQFCDQGRQYQAVIFYMNEQQKQAAIESKKKFEKRFKKITTQIRPSTQFYAAEDEHQKYYEKNPLRYKYYHWRCGREKRLEKLWQNN